MNPLEEMIREKIRDAGPMRFDRFMELALYHPEHGYYSRPRAIGRRGDFFTSVSVGPLFGRLLARQMGQMAELLGEREFWMVEQGAHDGRLACDILEAARGVPAFFEKLRYLIVEPSEDFQEAQERTAGPLATKMMWVKSLRDWQVERPAGVFISNELVDALPVRLIEARKGAWMERCVGLSRDEKLEWTLVPADAELEQAITGLPLVAAEGYRTEVGLAARLWMKEATAFLRRGYFVTIDYGFTAAEYYAPHRREGTLRGYRDHQSGDEVLMMPGGQDITAHVDFTALARIGGQAGWTPLALVDQQRFLTGILESGLELEAKEVRAFQTLTHPEHLGARFRVLVLAKDAPGGLAGLRFARSGGLD